MRYVRAVYLDVDPSKPKRIHYKYIPISAQHNDNKLTHILLPHNIYIATTTTRPTFSRSRPRRHSASLHRMATLRSFTNVPMALVRTLRHLGEVSPSLTTSFPKGYSASPAILTTPFSCATARVAASAIRTQSPSSRSIAYHRRAPLARQSWLR